MFFFTSIKISLLSLLLSSTVNQVTNTKPSDTIINFIKYVYFQCKKFTGL